MSLIELSRLRCEVKWRLYRLIPFALHQDVGRALPGGDQHACIFVPTQVLVTVCLETFVFAFDFY